MSDKKLRIEHNEWLDEAHKRYGQDISMWLFICPVCKNKNSLDDFRRQGVLMEDAIDDLSFRCFSPSCYNSLESKMCGPIIVFSYNNSIDASPRFDFLHSLFDGGRYNVEACGSH